AQSEIAGIVPFDIPSTGQTVLVLSKDPKRSNLTHATITPPASTRGANFLYLLHASAYTWGKVGQLIVKYQDGTTETIPVQTGQDIGNWWNPVLSKNAALVWSNTGGQSNYGLYESRFALQDKVIREITFESLNDSIWMIVGATLSPANIPLPQPQFYRVQQGKDWAPIATPMTVQPDSVLDFSSWTSTPAGKQGPVIVNEAGHFAFQSSPNIPVRFFGTNLNFTANFLPHKESDALALRLRQMGYNSVRIHHYDVLAAKGWNPTEYGLDDEMLDRLDYLFHAMKEQGLYISTDLFTIRRIRNEALKGFNGNNSATFKALIPISEAAMDDWKRFARDFLTRKNPYTGMTWAEDPALFSICPVNEDTIWAAINGDPQVKKLYQEDFKKWLQDNPRPVGNESQKHAAFNEYLAQKQIESDAEMSRFLKDELGVKALLTGNNWKRYLAQTPIRSEYDYVDDHGYWDHPSFPQGPWNFPYSFSQRSVVENLAELPRRLFLSRVEGIPFTVTEFNYSYPNLYRAEGGPVFGAYAALQGFDGIYRFAWAHDRKMVVGQEPGLGFDIAQDPIGLLTEHIIGMFWLRGDVPTFDEEAVFIVNDALAFGDDGTVAEVSAEDSVYKNTDNIDSSTLGKIPPSVPMDYTLLGLSKRISSRYEPEADSAQLNTEFTRQSPQSEYNSRVDDAVVQLVDDGDFLTKTPYSQALVFNDKSLDESFVRNVTGGPATIFVGSTDGQPIESAEQLLVLHLTNVLCDGATFGEKGMYSFIDPGTAQRLVRRGSAEITVPNASPNPTVYAVDLSGNRIGTVPHTKDSNGNIVFTAETIPSDRAPALVYEIIRQ
ncbi:MAG: hypothetical protein ACQKBV_07335, partial [Puniceicoccales bacterium]